MILTRFAKRRRVPPPRQTPSCSDDVPLGSFFPIELMPGFLQTLARTLPLYYVNEGLGHLWYLSTTGQR